MRAPKIRYVRYDEVGESHIVKRHVANPPAIGCATCGEFNGFGGLWEFGVYGGKTYYWQGLYCSLNCYLKSL